MGIKGQVLHLPGHRVIPGIQPPGPERVVKTQAGTARIWQWFPEKFESEQSG